MKKVKLAIHWQILIGLLLGVIVGVILNVIWDPDHSAEKWASMGVGDVAAYFAGHDAEANKDATTGAWIIRHIIGLNSFIGDLFIRALKLIAVPIVLFSLVVGASSLNDLKKLSRIGGKTIGIYICTTAVAITIGLVLANVIQPGKAIDQETREKYETQYQQEAGQKIQSEEEKEGFWDTMLDIVPDNPFNALAEGNMLQVVLFALLLGIALTLIPKEKAQPIIVFFDGMTDVVVKLVHIILLIAPYAVFALIARVVASMGLEVLAALVWYCLVVVLGLAIMILVVYPTILRLFTPMGFVRFFKGIAPAQLLAFSSSSSSATLPVTMECAEERLGVSEEVSSFVLPLGATVNMDGTALYQGVAAVFIAQMYGMDLTVLDQLTIVLTATLASIGTAGVPGVGMIMLIIVLRAAGIPLEGIAVILGVDRILDMCRTVVNITGDSMVATLIASTEKELLTEEQVRQRQAEMEQRGLDEHPRDESPHQYGVEMGGPGRPVEPDDSGGGAA